MDPIIVNKDLRTMTIPEDLVLLGVESDDDVLKIPFQMPREYSGFDLSTFQARINYMNAAGEGDVYIADDLTVLDDTTMTFTWLVGRNACKYKGETKFIVCLKLFDGDEVVKEFNTTVYSLPVLEGLETSEAVKQDNADIIEYLINLMHKSGVMDPSNYYTKTETNELIPQHLPNPESLVINGLSYDGHERVEMTISAESEANGSASGQIIHIPDAVPGKALTSLKLYAEGELLSSGNVVVTNKNLFRIDLITNHVLHKGITFDKQTDGSILCNGNSTFTNAMSSCALDTRMFEVGKTYTLSSGKTTGFVCVQLALTYTDDSTDYFVSKNAPCTFTLQKNVVSATGSIIVLEEGTSVEDEIVYPMLELADGASKFVMNTYNSFTFTGSNYPTMPDVICNIYSKTTTVTSITADYRADTGYAKIDEYIKKNFGSSTAGAKLVATYDGARTVSIGLG